MNLEQAQAFVEANKQPLTELNKLSRCVDGRYENIDNCPLIAKPGGDVGDVMAAFGALNLLQQSLPVEKVVNLVVEVVGSSKNFQFHSDDHANANEPGMGCGHFKHAKTDPEAFGVTAEQMLALNNILLQLLEQGAHQEILHGDHAEQAVIVVDSTSYGLLPLLRQNEEVSEAFVYHKTLHTQQLDKLAQGLQTALAEQGVAMEEQIVRKALDDSFGKQLTEILKRLAAGLPVYTARIEDDGVVTVSE
jgi:hypothetical protein